MVTCFFIFIETNSFDLSVKSDTNASLVKYEGVIHKYSFINDEIDECYLLEIQERVDSHRDY